MYSFMFVAAIAFAMFILSVIVKVDTGAQIIGTIIGTWISFTYFHQSIRVGVYFASEEKYRELCAAAPYLVYPPAE